MLVPITWIKDYTDINVSTEEFCEKMIMSGSNLETCETVGDGIEGIVIGIIDKIEKHPAADKLFVCQINVGKEQLVQIVTGAANVFEGAVVPVALDGSKIPGPLHGQPKQDGGVVIRRGVLRGVDSEGMLCSCSELGFEDKVVPTIHKDGIWILNDIIDKPVPGSDFASTMDLECSVVDFEITSNRPDCLSMIGMAREAAATFSGALRYPDTDIQAREGKSSDHIAVEVRNPEYCKRFVARAVTNVKVGQSPWWLQKRLMYAGMRPINNIVDITNFVMLEYGQPIHAYDIREIQGCKIVVDVAKSGETFTTLDGSERKLGDNILMINDQQKAIGIAGIMGGLESGIVSDTTTIIVEAANFNGDNIRASSKKLGLRTEASSRFEKGIDPNLCGDAAARVCRLIEILGAGTVMAEALDVYPDVELPKTCDVRVSRINSMLGIDLSREQMIDIFERLEMKASGEGDVMKVIAPTVRQDMLTEVDYVEEIARIYGYDKLPVTVPKGNLASSKSYERTLRDLARDTLCALGCNEVQTYSFVSPKGVDLIGIGEDSWERNFVRLINPLGEENSVMRTILTPNMMEVIARNYTRNIENVRAFEIGNTFLASEINEDGLPDEQDSLVIGFYGKDESFFTLKGVIAEFMKKLGICDLVFATESEYGVYHPGRCARIASGDVELGIMGEVHPDVAERYGIGTRIYNCEIMFDKVIKQANINKVYTPLAKHPSTARDIALLVKEDEQVGTLEAIIKESGTEILEKVVLFDVYRGAQVEPGMKSCAFNLVYRAKDRTLTDEEVNEIHGNVLAALKEKAGALLREM